MYCPTHRVIYDKTKKDQTEKEGFCIQRTVHIDLEAESRRKAKPVDLGNIRVIFSSDTSIFFYHVRSV